MVSSEATVSERPSCLAASSHSAFDVTLWQVDPLVTLKYPPILLIWTQVLIALKVRKMATAEKTYRNVIHLRYRNHF